MESREEVNEKKATQVGEDKEIEITVNHKQRVVLIQLKQASSKWCLCSCRVKSKK